MRLNQLTTARLVLAVISTSLEEVALWLIWRFWLPRMDIYLAGPVLITVMVAWLMFSAAFFFFVTGTLRKQAVVGLPTMMGCRGKVASPLAPEGFVKIKSELWGARSTEGSIEKGEEVMVVGQNGLMLNVKRRGAGKPAR